MERKETNLRCHSGCCSQPHPAMSAGIFLPSCHLEMRMPQPWGDCRSPSILEGWWSPPHFLLSGLEMGFPASQASPRPDNDEGSGPGSGVLGEERDGIRQGWSGAGGTVSRRWLGLGWRHSVLAPVTCFKALPGWVTQSFSGKPRSSIKDLVGYPLPLPMLESL